MVVNGQPKSTAEYIQASSRVGRGVEGLVLTLYNFGRPRDVSHFEHFSVYHQALYRSVEATSVTPWAPRARDKALHAVLAAAVRHLCQGMDTDDAAANFRLAASDVQELLDAISARADSASGGVEKADALRDLMARAAEWDKRSGGAAADRLDYWEKERRAGSPPPHLMYSAEEGKRRGGAAWPTPNSMREVEPSTAFMLKNFTRK